MLVPIVAGVVIKKDGKYLLVRESQPKAYGLWNFPAGKVDVGETIEEAAIREAKEETGYDVELVRKIDIFQNSSIEPPKHAFEARIIGGKLQYPKDELLDARWFEFKEIREMEDELRGEWILSSIIVLEGKRVNGPVGIFSLADSWNQKCVRTRSLHQLRQDCLDILYQTVQLCAKVAICNGGFWKP